MTALIWATAAARAYAASPEAHVYLNAGSHDKGGKPPSISASDARLLFAQRLGLSQYHSLGDVDEKTLRLLNEYGDWPKSLLRSVQDPRRLLVLVEGVQYPEGNPQQYVQPGLKTF